VSPPSAAADEPASYRGHRYPVELISHAVWLCFRFHLSLRDVEELLAERGVTVTYGTRLVFQVRPELRRWTAGATCLSERQMAPGRGAAQDQRPAALVVAPRGQAGCGPRHLGAAATRPARSRDFPAASDRVDRKRTASGDHRQAVALPPLPQCCKTSCEGLLTKGLGGTRNTTFTC